RAKGSIYYDRHAYTEEYYEKFYLDSVLWYCDKAIASDPEYGGAYHLKGQVYHHRGNIELASKNYEKAVVLSQNNAESFIPLYRLGYLYFFKKDYINGISLIRKAVQEAKGSPQDYRHILYRLGYAYMYIGAYEEAKDYFNNVRNLGWCSRLCYLDYFQGNFQASFDCISTCCANRGCVLQKANAYLQLKEFETSVKYFRSYRERKEELGRIQWNNLYREGYALIQMGNQEEGVELIEKQLAQLDKRKKLGRSDGYNYHYAAIYASRGDQGRALKHLRDYEGNIIFLPPNENLIPISFIQHDIMFEKLWDNEEFQAFVKRNQDEKAALRVKVREMEERGELDL
ncbi:MAG: hypothetical protein KAI99_18025, partial [Cyclobacteriaceae bacterium]|nr:hypothetical protein [Cyclobacteriaceae bacterium]